MKKKVATIATATILSSTFTTPALAATYTVQKGDNLSKIAHKYQISVAELMTLNRLKTDQIYVNQTLTVTSKSSTKSVKIATSAPAIKKASSEKTYTVVAGDTLIKIANKHNISLGELKTWNSIKDHIIFPGQKLKVTEPKSIESTKPTRPSASPAPIINNAKETEYVIKSGDTLSGIAQKFGKSVQELKSYNNLKSDVIIAGKKIKLTGELDNNIEKPPVTVEKPSSSVQNPSVSPSITKALNNAKKLVGTPYVFGGSTPSGFDCSGFIYFVFNQAGESMNRLSAAGYFDRSYYIETPQIGDLIFFKDTYKTGISHMGIYIGNDQFIHAGSSGVQISSVNSNYWKIHFDSFKRFY